MIERFFWKIWVFFLNRYLSVSTTWHVRKIKSIQAHKTTNRFEQDMSYFLLTIRVKIIPDLPQQLLFNFREKLSWWWKKKGNNPLPHVMKIIIFCHELIIKTSAGTGNKQEMVKKKVWNVSKDNLVWVHLWEIMLTWCTNVWFLICFY